MNTMDSTQPTDEPDRTNLLRVIAARSAVVGGIVSGFAVVWLCTATAASADQRDDNAGHQNTGTTSVTGLLGGLTGGQQAQPDRSSRAGAGHERDTGNGVSGVLDGVTKPVQHTVSSVTTPVQDTVSSAVKPVQHTVSSVTKPVQHIVHQVAQPVVHTVSTTVHDTVRAVEPVTRVVTSIAQPVVQTVLTPVVSITNDATDTVGSLVGTTPGSTGSVPGNGDRGEPAAQPEHSSASTTDAVPTKDTVGTKAVVMPETVQYQQIRSATAGRAMSWSHRGTQQQKMSAPRQGLPDWPSGPPAPALSGAVPSTADSGTSGGTALAMLAGTTGPAAQYQQWRGPPRQLMRPFWFDRFGYNHPS